MRPAWGSHKASLPYFMMSSIFYIVSKTKFKKIYILIMILFIPISSSFFKMISKNKTKEYILIVN